MTPEINEIFGKLELFASNCDCDGMYEHAVWLRKAAGALHSLSERIDTGWQPIETAPKDGTHILAYTPDGLHGPVQAVVYWYVHKGETFKETEIDGLYRKEEYEMDWWEGAGFTPFRATHWMPLPKQPSIVSVSGAKEP